LCLYELRYLYFPQVANKVSFYSIDQACEFNIACNTVRNIIRSGATDQVYERSDQPRPKLGSFIERLSELLKENSGKPIRHFSPEGLLDWTAASACRLNLDHDLAKNKIRERLKKAISELVTSNVTLCTPRIKTYRGHFLRFFASKSVKVVTIIIPSIKTYHGQCHNSLMPYFR